jgi:hypothetical protein
VTANNYQRGLELAKRSLPFVVFFAFLLNQFRNVLDLDRCSVNTLALYGDGLGTAWSTFIMQQQPFPPWQERTNWASYPEGEAFWTADWWASLLPRLLLYFFSNLFGPICAYNITAFLGISFTAIILLFFLNFVCRNRFVSLLGTCVIVFGPYMTSAIPGHILKLFLGVIPLVLLSSFRFLQTPSKKHLFLLATSAAFASYVDAYYTAMVGLILFCLTIVLFKTYPNLRLFIRISPALFWMLSILPLVIAYFTAPMGWASEFRSANELTVYRLKFWHLLLPGPENPFLTKDATSWMANSLGGSNFSETGLYITWTFLLFSLLTLFRFRGFRGGKSNLHNVKVNSNANSQDHVSIMYIWVSFTSVLLVAFLVFSMFPRVAIGALQIPGPARILFELTGTFRTLSRFGIVIVICCVVLGSISLAKFLETSQSLILLRFKQLMAVFLVVIELGFPVAQMPTVLDIRDVPNSYIWVSKNTPPNSVILDYLPWSIDGLHLGWGVFHQRRLINLWRADSPNPKDDFLQISESEVTCFLQQKGVNYILTHKSYSPILDIDNIQGVNLVYTFEQSRDLFNLDYSGKVYYVDLARLDSGSGC